MKCEVESEAIDSLKAMVQKLQDERDELLEACKIAYEAINFLGWSNQVSDALWATAEAGEAYRHLKVVIAKCTAKE